MNTAKIGQALRLLADAIDPQLTQPYDQDPPSSLTGVTATAPSAPKPRGRPPKGAETTPAVVAAPTAAAASATPATPASNLTHAIVAKSFKDAAAAHGRDFVVGAMKAYNAATFDKVPQDKWGEFKAYLDAGPKAAASAVADLMG